MEPLPENCPGPSSEEAGKSSPCRGCPSQMLCLNGPKEPDPDLPKIQSVLARMGLKLLVLSGKGGVGKSTLSTQLAYWLADSGERHVGLLDLDICGPSIPSMTGTSGQSLHITSSGWVPVYARENLAVMSVEYLLDNQGSAVIWRGTRKNGLLKQFLKDVEWGNLDVLVIDTPPGTSDEHLSIRQCLEGQIHGAIIVTTPQELSLQDVRKEINFCKKTNIPILGLVENMAGFACPNCSRTSFPLENDQKTKDMCRNMDVPFLGCLPLNPLIGKSSDDGIPWDVQNVGVETASLFQTIFDNLINSARNLQ